jgi:hypothetical protein
MDLRYCLSCSCMGCRHTYRTGTAICPKADCKKVNGHSYKQVEEIFLKRVEDMLLLCEDWIPRAEGEYPEPRGPQWAQADPHPPVPPRPHTEWDGGRLLV